MCVTPYQKLKPDQLDRFRFTKVVFGCAVAIILVILLAATAFGLYQHLASVSHNVPYPLMKSIIRANIYADHRIPEFLNKPHIVQYKKPQVSETKVVSCYYNTPSVNGPGQLLPVDIHPFLCTHINVAFAKIVNKELSLEPTQYKTLLDVVKLKKLNPNLKVLLSVGGAGNDNGFSDMVINHASRKIFIKSIKATLHNYTLDGIDLDWEFPAVHQDGNQVKLVKDKRERQHFSQLLREIRNEYIREKRNYILTVAVAAPETIVDASYDVDQLNLYTDYVNIMTYDFHSYTKFTPFTGLNSPLFPRASEQLYLATLNINYTTQLYMNKGLDKSKIVVGIPTYGHSFTLVNPDNTMIGSPSSGVGTLGGMGFVNYPDLCLFVNKHNDAVIKQDPDAKVPYLYKGREWVSYDSPASVALKAAYIKRLGLGGAMIYSLNADDFGGVCHRGLGADANFPLSRSIKNTLFGGDTVARGEREEKVRPQN